MPSAYAQAAAQLKTVIDTEFAPEGYTAIFDNLHPALGDKRVCIGINPVNDAKWSRNANVKECTIQVKFFGLWQKKVDPNLVVNPTTITTYAERFTRALQKNGAPGGAGSAGTGELWFMNCVKIDYPLDPTGNNSRFVATIRCYGDNPSYLYETGA